MNLGENIYRLRTQKNMSQGDLADALEISRQSVSKWENNSAVPELEKLMKMAQIFEITIDELVTGMHKADAAAPAQPEPEPKVIYIERNSRPGLSAAQVLGILLLFCTALIVGLSLVFGDRQELEEWIPLCILTALCGILCLVAKYPALWCSWVCTAGYWLYFFILSVHWEEQAFLIVFGILLVAAALAFTVLSHRKGKVRIQPWVWALLGIILVCSALLLICNLLPPAQGSVTYPNKINIYPEQK